MQIIKYAYLASDADCWACSPAVCALLCFKIKVKFFQHPIYFQMLLTLMLSVRVEDAEVPAVLTKMNHITLV